MSYVWLSVSMSREFAFSTPDLTYFAEFCWLLLLTEKLHFRIENLHRFVEFATISAVVYFHSHDFFTVLSPKSEENACTGR